ncbi:MAG: hypothetical protein J0H31_02450 [Alphaproteobacteria bacterium]|nr:hypothetical protein [Alphaproteobacteria bacterium]
MQSQSNSPDRRAAGIAMEHSGAGEIHLAQDGLARLPAFSMADYLTLPASSRDLFRAVIETMPCLERACRAGASQQKNGG